MRVDDDLRREECEKEIEYDRLADIKPSLDACRAMSRAAAGILEKANVENQKYHVAMSALVVASSLMADSPSRVADIFAAMVAAATSVLKQESKDATL